MSEYIPTLVKSGGRSAVIRLPVVDTMENVVTYAAIAAILPVGCDLKPLMAATYTSNNAAAAAFAAEGMTLSVLNPGITGGMTPVSGAPPAVAVDAFAMAGSVLYGVDAVYLRIALDHSLTN